MKILIVSNMYPSPQKPYAGVFVRNQYARISGLLAKDESIDVYAMKRKITGIMGSLFKYLLAFIKFIPLTVKRYDIIHVHFFHPTIYFALFYKLFHPKSRIVVTYHGGDLPKNKVVRKVFAGLSMLLTYNLAVGKDTAKEILSAIGVNVQEILCAGIDRSMFYRMAGLQKEYDFLFVGSFYARKGIDIFLHAVEMMHNDKIRVCIAGSGPGPFDQQIKSYSERYNITIKLNQTQDQLRELYNMSSFMVLPSRYEPFGLVVTEALFCGTPVIVSNVGGLAEQVVDGVNGYILPENSPSALATVMKKATALIADMPSYEIMANAAVKSNDAYSLDAVCRRLVEIYREVSSRQRPH